MGPDTLAFRRVTKYGGLTNLPSSAAGRWSVIPTRLGARPLSFLTWARHLSMDVSNRWQKPAFVIGHKLSPFLLLFLTTSCTSVSQRLEEPAATSEEEAILSANAYVPPVLITPKTPRFPHAPRRLGKEGWVVLDFMVDPKGKPYEIEATRLGGHKSFVEEAVRAVEQFVYEPASLNGRPVHARTTRTIRFSLGDKLYPRVSRDFFHVYQNFLREAFEANSETAIHQSYQQLSAFGIQKTGEMELLNFAKALYASRIKDHFRAMEYLTDALSLENEDSVFQDEERLRHLQSLFWLQFHNKNFGAALDTWQRIEPKLSDSRKRSSYTNLVTQILGYKESERAFAARRSINGTKRFAHKLLTNAFTLSNVEGSLTTAKLYCISGFIIYEIELQVRYVVPPNLSDCRLVVTGSPNTTFTISENP